MHSDATKILRQWVKNRPGSSYAVCGKTKTFPLPTLICCSGWSIMGLSNFVECKLIGINSLHRHSTSTPWKEKFFWKLYILSLENAFHENWQLNLMKYVIFKDITRFKDIINIIRTLLVHYHTIKNFKHLNKCWTRHPKERKCMSSANFATKH